MRRRDSFITSPKKDQSSNRIDALITVVILAENQVHRMKSYGPISLLNIEGKTLIERQISAIKSAFLNFEIILCCGFESNKTVAYVKNKFPSLNIRMVDNQIHYNSNCCESVRLCLANTMNSKVVVCNGGLLFTADQLSSFDFKNTSVLVQTDNDDSNLEIGVIHDEDRLESLGYGIKDRYWSEILYLNGIHDISKFHSIVSTADYKNRFLFEAINEFSRKNDVKTVFVKHGKETVRVDNVKTIKGRR